MSEPPSPDALEGQLRQWARRTRREDSDLVAGPDRVTGGLDTFIYRFQLTDTGPLILRLYPTASRGASAAKEAAVLGFLHDLGYPAPRVVAHAADTADFGLPYVVMEQAPGRTVLNAVKAHPLRTAALLDSLAAAQASLHGVDPSDWPLPPAPGSEIDRRLAGVDDQAIVSAGPDLQRALRWLRSNCDVARDEDPVVCHNDFHPLNAIVDDDGHLAVIDWEGASLGDRHSDLARTLVLFEWAPAVAGSAVERLVLRAAKPWILQRYRRAYERHLPIDDGRLHYWLAFHAAESWWEAASLLDGRFDRDTRTDERAGPAAVVAPAMARLFARLVPAA